MASVADTITVKVHLDIDLDGVPISCMFTAPATAVLDKGEGLAVHLHLDGKELARALVKHMAREMAQQQQTHLRTDGRAL